MIRDSFRDVAVRFSLTPENSPKHPSNCETSWVTSDQSKGVQYFVASRQGESVGCAGLERGPEGVSYLERLAVLPEHRRQGLGAALVGHAASRARSNGSTRLGAAIIAEHTDLKDWYLRLGFVETGTKSFPHLPFTVAFLELQIL
jgi:GNAT superfamily N-acetyltransferase